MRFFYTHREAQVVQWEKTDKSGEDINHIERVQVFSPERDFFTSSTVIWFDSQDLTGSVFVLSAPAVFYLKA